MYRFATGILCVASLAAHAADGPTQELMRRAVHHQQAWGTLGIDQRAFDPARGSSPLRIGEKTYARGLGAHAPQETVIALRGQYLAFDCEVGVQLANGAGSVVFQVYVDDKQVFDSGEMKEATPAKPVHIELKGAQELRLVATDAGDGINSDLANWADARLTPDSNAPSAPNRSKGALDIAPFAKVVTSDPAKMEGTKAKRTEEFPAADVFPDEELAPDQDGKFSPRAYAGGAACIGLQWLERRKPARVALHFVEASAPAPEQVRLEAWDGLSRWQGTWHALDVKPARNGNAIEWNLGEAALQAGTNGALQLRWIFDPATKAGMEGARAFQPAKSAPPAEHQPDGQSSVRGLESPRSLLAGIRVTRFEAWSESTTAETTIQLERTPNAPAGHTNITPYNTALLSPSTSSTDYTQSTVSWDMAAPLKLRLRYITPRTWQASDRSLLRLELPEGLTTIAMDTLLAKGQLYVPSANLYVRLLSQSPQSGNTQSAQREATRTVTDGHGKKETDTAGASVIPAKAGTQAEPAHASPALDEYRKQIAEEKTILDRVHAMPDQTLEQATAHNARKDANLGPTLLSLPCDNRKFLLERDGAILWSDDPAIYDAFDHSVDPGTLFNCKLTLAFAGKRSEFDTIAPKVPVNLKKYESEGVTYTTTFKMLPADWVPTAPSELPFDFAPPSNRPERAPWWSEQPLGTIKVQIRGDNGNGGNARFDMACFTGSKLTVPAHVTLEGDKYCFRNNGHLLVWLTNDAYKPVNLSADENGIHFSAQIKHETVINFHVFIPRWPQATPDADSGSWTARHNSLWKVLNREPIFVATPDMKLNQIIARSQDHILMAARNDHGRTIAPWIGSIHYGPLESEAHAVIRGMMAMGQEDFARRSLLYFVERYNKEGFLTTGYTVMGTGWHLWTLGEFYSLYRDKEFMKQIAPEVVRVCKWVSDQRAKTRRNGADAKPLPEAGLMPPGPLADWNLSAYYFYGNMYYAAGLEGVGAALEDIGWPGADAIRKEGTEFRETILRALDYASRRAPVVPLRDGTCVPFYPCQLYTPGAIGDLYPGEDANRSWCYDVELGSQHLIPTGLLDPKSAAATAMMNYLEDVQFLREGWFYYPAKESEADWFNRGGFAKVQPYYARTGDVYALRDDPKAFLRNYFNTIPTLLNPEDLSFWEHFMNGAYNKTHETGYFLYETSQMLAQARGEELWLAPLIPSAWLEDKQGITVQRLPTRFGRVGYSAVPDKGGNLAIEITPPDREMPKAIVLRLRRENGKPIARVEIAAPHKVPFTFDKGTIRFQPRDVEPFQATVYYQ